MRFNYYISKFFLLLFTVSKILATHLETLVIHRLKNLGMDNPKVYDRPINILIKNIQKQTVKEEGGGQLLISLIVRVIKLIAVETSNR